MKKYLELPHRETVISTNTIQTKPFDNQITMSNNKQSSVEWLISQLQRSKDWHRVLNEVSQMSSAEMDIVRQANEMEVAGREMSYSDGYAEGYKRALDYMTMSIKNAIGTKDK